MKTRSRWTLFLTLTVIAVILLFLPIGEAKRGKPTSKPTSNDAASKRITVPTKESFANWNAHRLT